VKCWKAQSSSFGVSVVAISFWTAESKIKCTTMKFVTDQFLLSVFVNLFVTLFLLFHFLFLLQ
jgi:hypothetical protein